MDPNERDGRRGVQPMLTSSCTPTAAEPYCGNFTCCTNGPFQHERSYYGRPVMDFGVEAALMVGLLLIVLAGGLLNVMSPMILKPKGALAPLFYQRLGSGLFLRITPAELIGVLCVVGFYIARFIAYYRLYAPYEISLEPGFPGSNGRARSVAQALEECYYVALPIQISLGVKNGVWFWLAGLPVERAAAYHAYHGYTMAAFIIVAWICYGIGGFGPRSLTAQFCFCDVNPMGGLIAAICTVPLTLMSLPIEYFYLMGHFQLIFPVLWGSFFNDRVAIFPYYVAAFACWGWSDLPMRVYMKAFQPTRVLQVSVKNENVAVRKLTRDAPAPDPMPRVEECRRSPMGVWQYLKLTKKKADGSGKTLGLLTSQWESGSYVWVAVRMPNANPLKGQAPPPFSLDWACYHPMTITTPPIDAEGKPSAEFTIHVKSMGPGTWSQALVDKIGQVHRDGLAVDSLKVWIGGPNGKLTFSPLDCDRVVMCAGGIGVTPFIALAQELIYRARLGQKVPEMELIWVERNASNFSVFDDELTRLTTSETALPIALKLYCTRPGTSDGELKVHGTKVVEGRPKFVELLATSGSMSGEIGKVDPTSNRQIVVGVYSCGPPQMMGAVRAAVQGASSPTAKFYLHEETFEL